MAAGQYGTRRRTLRERLRSRGSRQREVSFANVAPPSTPAWPLAPEVALLAVEEPPAPPELSDEREQAVFIYCRELLRQPTADDAATDALVGFWHLLLAHHNEEAADPPGDDALLAITRRMVAVSMPDRGSPSERRQAMIASIDTEPQCSCRETAFLLAARANDSIEPRESVSLTHHLDACPECRALDAHMERATQAFLAALHPPESAESPETTDAAHATVTPESTATSPDATATPEAAVTSDVTETEGTTETPDAADGAQTPEPPETEAVAPDATRSGAELDQPATEQPDAPTDVDGNDANPTAVAPGERLGAGVIVSVAGIVVLAVVSVIAVYVATYRVTLAVIHARPRRRARPWRRARRRSAAGLDTHVVPRPGDDSQA